jgi:cobalt-precorrin 5A hydrolase
MAALNAGRAMGFGEDMAVIGIGTTSRVTVEDLLAIIEAAKIRMRKLPSAREGGITILAALDRPAINPILADAARLAGLRLLLTELDQLRAAAPLCLTHSEKSMKQYGIPSVAEAAALAALGPGATILLPRFCGRNTTASVAA